MIVSCWATRNFSVCVKISYLEGYSLDRAEPFCLRSDKDVLGHLCIGVSGSVCVGVCDM